MSSDTHLGISTQQARHPRELQVPCSPYTVIMRHSGVDTTPTLWDTGQTHYRTGTRVAQHSRTATRAWTGLGRARRSTTIFHLVIH